MTRIPVSLKDERIQAALAEMKELILARFPDATFGIFKGEDPWGIYLEATVDVDDTDDVIDVFIDRLVDMQVEEGLPVYVLPVQPAERVIELMEQRRQRQRSDHEPNSIHPA